MFQRKLGLQKRKINKNIVDNEDAGGHLVTLPPQPDIVVELAIVREIQRGSCL